LAWLPPAFGLVLLPAGIELPLADDLTILPKPPTLVMVPGAVTGVKPEVAVCGATTGVCSDAGADAVATVGTDVTDATGAVGTAVIGVTAGTATGAFTAGTAAGVATAGADTNGVIAGAVSTFLTTLIALTALAGDFAFLTTVSTITSVFLAGLISGNWFNLLLGI